MKEIFPRKSVSCLIEQETSCILAEEFNYSVERLQLVLPVGVELKSVQQLHFDAEKRKKTVFEGKHCVYSNNAETSKHLIRMGFRIHPDVLGKFYKKDNSTK